MSLHTVFHKRLALSSLLSLSLFLSSQLCIAQTGPIWKVLETGLSTEPIFDRFHFVDSLRGYAYSIHGNRNGRITAFTTDAGETWMPGDLSPAIRWTYGDTIVLPEGKVSFDGGTSWNAINPADADANLTPSLVYLGYAASARHFATIFVGSQIFTDPGGTIGGERLAWTTDGGTSWQTADSAAYTNPGYKLVPRHGYGPFPGNNLARWNFIAGYIDTTHLLVVRSGDPHEAPEYYLGNIDLQKQSATWITLPFWKNVSPGSADRIPLIRVVSPGLLVAMDYPRSGPYPLWKSLDTGKTWQEIHAPESVSFSHIRFINDSLWIAPTAYSTDGGATWTERMSFWIPYSAGQGTSGSFHIVDTSVYLFGEGPLLARSTDAGKTWARNSPAFPVRSMIARDGRIIEARGKHALRVSTDNGESWIDRGKVTGELPDNLNMVVSLAWYDTATAPDRAFGAALFVPEAGPPYTAIIETTDGGINWSERAKIEGAEAFTGVSPLLQFVPSLTAENRTAFLHHTSGLYTSADEGLTWQRVQTWSGPYALAPLLMLNEQRGVMFNYAVSSFSITANGGADWIPVSLPIDVPIRYLLDKPAVAGTSRIVVPVRGENDKIYLLYSDSEGNDWKHKILSPPFTASGAWIWLDTAHLYVAAGGSLYYSANGGDSFIAIQELPIHGEYQLPPELVARDSRYLYFDLNPLLGRRLITPQHTTGVTLREGRQSTLRLQEISVSDGAVRFRYSAAQAGTVRAELFDLLGTKVAEQGLRAEGREAEQGELQTGNLPSGSYLLRISRENGEAATGLIRLVR